jgi:hypothetical protein
VSVTNPTKPGQVTHVIAEIESHVRSLLSTQRTEIEKEIREKVESFRIPEGKELGDPTPTQAYHYVLDRIFSYLAFLKPKNHE